MMYMFDTSKSNRISYKAHLDYLLSQEVDISKPIELELSENPGYYLFKAKGYAIAVNREFFLPAEFNKKLEDYL